MALGRAAGSDAGGERVGLQVEVGVVMEERWRDDDGLDVGVAMRLCLAWARGGASRGSLGV